MSHNKVILNLEDRIIGRISSEKIKNPITGKIIVRLNEEITEIAAKSIVEAGIKDVKIRSVITCQSERGVCARCYGRDLSKGEIVSIGDAVGIIAAQSIGGYDIQFALHSSYLEGVQVGLPRIAELFEARSPHDKNSPDPQNILIMEGVEKTYLFLLNELQMIFKLQKISINDKHIEIIIRQMMKKVQIEDSGDTGFIKGEYVDKMVFAQENQSVQKQKGRTAKSKPALVGITKASMNTDSFIAAASFQDTTRVLTEAAISGATDELRGLKENVIMGRLIPAGTGMPRYRDTFVKRVKKR